MKKHNNKAITRKSIDEGEQKMFFAKGLFSEKPEQDVMVTSIKKKGEILNPFNFQICEDCAVTPPDFSKHAAIQEQMTKTEIRVVIELMKKGLWYSTRRCIHFDPENMAWPDAILITKQKEEAIAIKYESKFQGEEHCDDVFDYYEYSPEAESIDFLLFFVNSEKEIKRLKKVAEEYSKVFLISINEALKFKGEANVYHYHSDTKVLLWHLLSQK